ncbi:cyclase family protein [Algoriphagus namhaensis]
MNRTFFFVLLLPVVTLALMASCQYTGKNETINHPLALEQMEWIDLTHAFDSSTLYWPNNPTEFEHEVDAYGITDQGYFYSSYSLSTPEHGGTHLDAPIHFSEGKLTSDKIPLSSLIGKAIVIDVAEKALQDRDYLISSQDILDWEQANGELEEGTIILFKTGFGQFYPDREKYFGTPKKGDAAIPQLHFPGIAPEAAELLVERKAKAVGLDTPSLDFGQSKDFKTHQILMGANIPGFENVANLDLLPNEGFYIVALPMKIKGGSGGPLRIVAAISPD